MKISEENKALIVKWIKEKCGNIRCICCGNGKWQLSDISMVQIGFNLETTRFHFHEGVPTVSIVCETCGHIELFAPGIIGIRPKPPKEEKVEKPNEVKKEA
jgi:hypothetical protein